MLWDRHVKGVFMENRNRDNGAPTTNEADSRMLWYGILVLAVLITLLVVTSLQNIKKYYLKSSQGSIELWQGTFSPNSQKRILIMPGVQPPKEPQDVYTQADVYPLAFRYYLDKADTLMDVPGLLDFAGIRSYLNSALDYATADTQRREAIARLNRIDRTVLIYKAEVAASKGSVAGLEQALTYLDQASELTSTDIELKLVESKVATIDEVIQNLKLEPKPDNGD